MTARSRGLAQAGKGALLLTLGGLVAACQWVLVQLAEPFELQAFAVAQFETSDLLIEFAEFEAKRCAPEITCTQPDSTTAVLILYSGSQVQTVKFDFAGEPVSRSALGYQVEMLDVDYRYINVADDPAAAAEAEAEAEELPVLTLRVNAMPAQTGSPLQGTSWQWQDANQREYRARWLNPTTMELVTSFGCRQSMTVTTTAALASRGSMQLDLPTAVSCPLASRTEFVAYQEMLQRLQQTEAFSIRDNQLTLALANGASLHLTDPHYTHLDTLQRQRALWDSLDLDHYRMTLMRDCACDPTALAIDIEVVESQVVSAVDHYEGFSLLNDPFSYHQTIDDLFAQIESALLSGSDRVVVTYSAQGYPTRVTLQHSFADLGSGVHYEVSALEAF